MADSNTIHTPVRPSASPGPRTVTFTRSTSRRELFESTAPPTQPNTPTSVPQSMPEPSSSHSGELGPRLDGLLAFDFLGGGTSENVFSNAPAGIIAASAPLDVGKYRQIAENAGLRGEQADTAVGLAIMTPRSARVQLYSQVTHAINLIGKFREVQVKNWEIPSKVKTQAHTVVRLALLAPIPFCYKDDLPLLVLRILIKDGTVSKDFETKHHQRADIVMKEISRHAGHVRSEMKSNILGSITPESHIDILTLTTTLSKACGSDVNVTKELLCAVAYLRGLTALQAEDRTPVALKADEKIWWRLIEHRVKETRARHNTLDARRMHLHKWLEDDQLSYGRVDAEKLAALRTDSTVLQAAVFEAQRRGTEELKKDLARTM